jgi:hypothetical protein
VEDRDSLDDLDNLMSLYDSVVHVEKVHGTHRRATLPTGQTIDFGVHGPIAAHFRLQEQPMPLPVDYIVASTAG